MITKGSILFFLLVATLHVFAYNQKDFEKHFRLLPHPKEVVIHSEKGISPAAVHGIFFKGSYPRPILYGLLNALPYSPQEADGVVVMNLSDEKGLPESAEGYKLDVGTKRI